MVRAKKKAKKGCDSLRNDWEEYNWRKKEAKRAVAIAKSRALDELYEELYTTGGVKRLYSVARAREKASKDFTHVRQIKDE